MTWEIMRIRILFSPLPLDAVFLVGSLLDADKRNLMFFGSFLATANRQQRSCALIDLFLTAASVAALVDYRRVS